MHICTPLTVSIMSWIRVFIHINKNINQLNISFLQPIGKRHALAFITLNIFSSLFRIEFERLKCVFPCNSNYVFHISSVCIPTLRVKSKKKEPRQIAVLWCLRRAVCACFSFICCALFSAVMDMQQTNIIAYRIRLTLTINIHFNGTFCDAQW